MILPIRTSIQPRRTPYVNYGLIAVNVIIFLLTFHSHRVFDQFGNYGGEAVLREWAAGFKLIPGHIRLYQFVTYAFLHASWAHIIGNMFFLYMFGNNVNDKLGNVGYLCFYLAGAVFSGIGHVAFSTHPVLGASGAVAAVTGAYLILFPKTLVTVVYWFFFIGTFDVAAYWFILFKLIAIDNFLARIEGVAYDAHVAGYAFGIVSIFVLLAMKILDGSQIDAFFAIKQWNRRREFRDASTDGYDPFSRGGTKKVAAKEVKSPAEQEKENKVYELRAKISGFVGQKNLAEAANVFVELQQVDKGNVLPTQQQLDIANQLMSMGQYAESAEAYGNFLNFYKKASYSEQVELMLGILYSRYLNEPVKAVKFFESARENLTDPGQIKMCDDELAKLKNK